MHMTARSVLLSVFVVGAWGLAAAAEEPPAGGNSDNTIVNGLPGTLGVDPGIINTTARPGQTLNIPITLSNNSKDELVAAVTAEDIVPDQGDLPVMALKQPAPAHSTLKGWLSGLSPIDLAPGAKQVLPVSINVPANAMAGSHLGALRVVSAPVGKSPNTQSGSQGALIFLRVQGAALDKLAISSIGTGQTNADHKFFAGRWFSAFPVDFTATVRNLGDVHHIPAGTLSISDVFGHVVAKLPFSTDGDVLLPGGSSPVSQLITGHFHPGRYTATLQLPYGQSQKLEASTSFWVVPMWMWGVGLVVFLLAYGLAMAWLKRRNGPSHGSE
jgi:hypothetical protein